MGLNSENSAVEIPRPNVGNRPIVQIDPAPRGNRNQTRSVSNNTSQAPSGSSLKDSFASGREAGEDVDMSDSPQDRKLFLKSACSSPTILIKFLVLMPPNLPQLQVTNERLQDQVNDLIQQRDELLATRDQQQTLLKDRTEVLGRTQALVTTANVEVGRLRRDLNETQSENSALVTRVETLENCTARRLNVLRGEESDHSTDITESDNRQTGASSNQGEGNDASQGNTGGTNRNSNHHPPGLDRQDRILDGDYDDDPCREIIRMFHTQLCIILDDLTGDIPDEAKSPRRTLGLISHAIKNLINENKMLMQKKQSDTLKITELEAQLGSAIGDRQEKERQIQQLRQQAQHASPRIREYIINMASRYRLLFNNDETTEALPAETPLGDLRQLEYQINAALDTLQNLKSSNGEIRKRNVQLQVDNEKLNKSLAMCKIHGQRLSESMDK